MPTERRIVRELRRAGFTVRTRRQWGSRRGAVYQWRRVNRRFVGPADHFFAHVTVTNPSGDFDEDMRTLEDIGQARFGTGISYNWGVDQRTGAIGVGQPLDAAGAHTLNDKNVAGFPDNLNYWGHAIAWVGNVGHTPSRKALDAYSAIMAAEKKHGAAKRSARIYPHSMFAAKECPLESLRSKLDEILARSRTILRTADDAAAKRAQRRAERRAERKAERAQERREAERQRRREELWQRATGDTATGRVDRARALVRIAANRADKPVRARLLRDWLRGGPKQ